MWFYLLYRIVSGWGYKYMHGSQCVWMANTHTPQSKLDPLHWLVKNFPLPPLMSILNMAKAPSNLFLLITHNFRVILPTVQPFLSNVCTYACICVFLGSPRGAIIVYFHSRLNPFLLLLVARLTGKLKLQTTLQGGNGEIDNTSLEFLYLPVLDNI